MAMCGCIEPQVKICVCGLGLLPPRLNSSVYMQIWHLTGESYLYLVTPLHLTHISQRKSIKTSLQQILNQQTKEFKYRRKH